MDISLGQLEAFVSVVENRSFSKAGEELFLSQSTISSHIAKLERALQTTLLQRREKKNVEPTEEGMQAYRSAVQILSQAKALEAMFRQEVKDQPVISIASSTVPSSYILPDILNGYNASKPECRFLVLDGDSSFALDRLQTGEAVFAFVGTRSRKSMICYHTVCRDRMVLITPKTAEYMEKKKQGMLGHELLDRPMILRESGSGTRRETDNYLRSIGVDPADLTVAAYMNNIEGIKSMVAGGGGVSILSERAARDAIQSSRVLRFDLEEDGPYRDISIAYLRNRCFNGAEQAFLNYVKKLDAFED